MTAGEAVGRCTSSPDYFFPLILHNGLMCRLAKTLQFLLKRNLWVCLGMSEAFQKVASSSRRVARRPRWTQTMPGDPREGAPRGRRARLTGWAPEPTCSLLGPPWAGAG